MLSGKLIRKYGLNARPSAIAAVATAARALQLLQPRAAIMIGSGARQNSRTERGEPDINDANSSAEQSPAPSPTKPICHQNRVIAQLSRPVSKIGRASCRG